MTQRLIVAGVAGGVGTTTVVAMLFAELSPAPLLIDHSGGDLGGRLTGGDDTPTIDDLLTLHDIGAHPAKLLETLEEPDTLGLIVTSTTEAGFVLAHRTLASIRERYGSGGISRVLVATVGVFGHHRTARRSDAIRAEFGPKIIVVFPQDVALAAGGRVPQNRLSPQSVEAQRLLATSVRNRATAFRR
jgi:hypothetical protein